jgi:hypothetical protein
MCTVAWKVCIILKMEVTEVEIASFNEGERQGAILELHKIPWRPIYLFVSLSHLC